MNCIKCHITYKKREVYSDEDLLHPDLCSNCKSIWTFIKLTVEALGKDNPFRWKQLNRDIIIRLEDVKITKKKKVL